MKHLFILLFLFAGTALYAQHRLQGRVVNKQNGERIEMATVRLFVYHGTDSVLVHGQQTDMEGEFLIKRLQDGEYRLIISSVGYKEYSVAVRMAGKDVVLHTLYMEEDVQVLGEVQVRGTAAEMVVKGDTLEYNANAYKTAENAIAEDLLKKMPGVEIDENGNVTVNGESITGVRIDGKKFFGDDVQMATKNLPAAMIDKVQVIDEKSDMAQLTGFEDDETERVINFTLKESRKKGMFGNFIGGLGADIVSDNGKVFGYDKDFVQNDFRYNANAFMNFLLGESRTTVIGGANNTNELRSGRGRGSMQGANSGINWTENIGVNTNISTRGNLLVGGDASMNHSRNYTLSESRQENYADDLIYYNYDNRDNTSGTWDAQMRLELEWQIDSANKLLIQPRLAYTNSVSIARQDYTYLRDADTITDGYQRTESAGQETGAGLRLIYSHKFRKPGRTLTLNGNAEFNNTTNEGFSKAQNIATATEAATLIDHFTRKRTDAWNYSLKVSYVEPLLRTNHFMEAAFTLAGSNRHSDKKQYNPDAVTGDYAVFDSLYSNTFANRFFSEKLELNYRYIESNFDLTAGVQVNPSQTFTGTVYGSGETFNRRTDVWNFSPNLSFKYKFGKKEFARLMYRGATVQPTIAQQEPVRDNSDAMSETVGNPDLSPAFRHTLRVMYSRFNGERLSSVTAGIRGTFTKDALVGNSVYDETGKLWRQTVNASVLPYSVGADLMYSTPVVKKRFHLNTRTDIAYDRRVAYLLHSEPSGSIDIENLPLGNESRTGHLRLSEDLSLRFTHDIADIGVRGNVVWSRTDNSLNRGSLSHVLNWGVRGDVTFHLPCHWSIATDCGYTARYGYGLEDVNEVIWNANIDKTWGNVTLSVRVYDLLNQKKNIVQTVSDHTVTYAKYNTLPTYFMVSFTYKLNRMGGMKNADRDARMQDMREGSLPPPEGRRPEMPLTGPPPER